MCQSKRCRAARMDTYGVEFELSIDVKRLLRKVQPRSEVDYDGTTGTGSGTGEVRPSCAAGALLEEGLITPPFASSKHVFLSGSCFCGTTPPAGAVGRLPEAEEFSSPQRSSETTVGEVQVPATDSTNCCAAAQRANAVQSPLRTDNSVHRRGGGDARPQATRIVLFSVVVDVATTAGHPAAREEDSGHVPRSRSAAVATPETTAAAGQKCGHSRRLTSNDPHTQPPSPTPQPKR